MDRDFSTISPSAKALLLLKGVTNIPYAREAAELISLPEKYTPDFTNRDIGFWARIVHFESRYWSIDQLLADLPLKNIIELSSGFSLRGLNVVKQSDINYLDTDLPNVIDLKKKIIEALNNDDTDKGLKTLPLNALVEDQFTAVVNQLPKGETAIINEGLLVYLNTDEKKKLCSIIRNVLKNSGGYWITADIYIKNTYKKLNLNIDDKLQQFFAHHNIEENKFDSFEAAESFFKNEGFIIDKEAQPEQAKLSSLKYLLNVTTPSQLLTLQNAGKIRATWRLKLAD